MSDALGLGEGGGDRNAARDTSSVHVKSCRECRKVVKKEEEEEEEGGHQKGQ